MKKMLIVLLIILMVTSMSLFAQGKVETAETADRIHLKQ